MAAVLCKEPDEYRVRRLDMWGAPDAVLDDDTPLSDSGLNNGELVWLEAGKVREKGALALRAELFSPCPPEPPADVPDLRTPATPTPAAAAATDATLPADAAVSDAPGGAAAQPLEQQPATASVQTGVERPNPCVWMSSPAVHLHLASSRADDEAAALGYALTALDAFEANERWTVGQLREHICRLPGVPGLDTERLLLWRREGQLLRQPSASLKRAGVTDNSTIVASVADEPLVSAMADESAALLLFVQSRHPVSGRLQPAQEVLFSGNSVSELRELVAARVGTHDEHLVVAKFNKFSRLWLELPRLNDSAAPVASAEVSHVHEPPVDESAPPPPPPPRPKLPGPPVNSVRARPYLLRDGDVIVCSDARREGREWLQVALPTPAPKRSTHSLSALKKKARSPEPALSIRLSFAD